MFFRLQAFCITVMGDGGMIFLDLVSDVLILSSVQAFAVNRYACLLISVCTKILKLSQHNHIKSVVHVMLKDVVQNQCKLYQHLKIQSMQIKIQSGHSLFYGA